MARINHRSFWSQNIWNNVHTGSEKSRSEIGREASTYLPRYRSELSCFVVFVQQKSVESRWKNTNHLLRNKKADQRAVTRSWCLQNKMSGGWSLIARWSSWPGGSDHLWGLCLVRSVASDLNETVKVALCKNRTMCSLLCLHYLYCVGTRVMLIKMWTEFKYSYFLPPCYRYVGACVLCYCVVCIQSWREMKS